MFIFPTIVFTLIKSDIYLSVAELLSQFIALLANLLNPYGTLTAKDFELLEGILWIYLPWLIFAGLLKLFWFGISRARKRKTGVVILATFLQMFTPDPYVERTVKTVQLQTKKQKESDKKVTPDEPDNMKK